MKLEWEGFIGPGIERAVGFGGVFILSSAEKGTRLYLFEHGIALCPINKQRAKLAWDLTNADEAKEKAQWVEDRMMKHAVELIDLMEGTIT